MNQEGKDLRGIERIRPQRPVGRKVGAELGRLIQDTMKRNGISSEQARKSLGIDRYAKRD